MRRLYYYITNPFRAKGISLTRLIRFTTDLLERFKARNDNGQFDTRIAATESALDVLDAAYTVDIGKLGIRKARKATKNRFRETLSIFIETVYGKLIAVYGGKSEALSEFFPKGRTIFNRCGDDDLKYHLSNIVDQVTLHQAELGTDLLDEVTALRDEWEDIHDESEESTGLKAATEADRRDARAGLEDELFENLLMISSLHKHEPDKLGLYMQQYLLGGPATGPVTGGNDTPPPMSGSTSGSNSSTVTSGSSIGSSSMGSNISGGSTSLGSSMTSSSSATSMSGSSIGSTGSTGSSSSI